MTDFAKLLMTLHAGGVDFIVIGGVALVTHGHVRHTVDLDVCYSRQADNLARLARTVGALHPRLRGAPPELPFFFDERTLRNGLNFTLVTDAGELDLLGEVTGVGGFDDLLPGASLTELYGVPVRVMGLDDLERAKAAAGRAKDLLDLEAIRALKKLSSS